jgi:cytochrome b pre-mRNA-processing protein 3
MFNFLFPRLTRAPSEGEALFDALTKEARRPHWYLEGEVPDTIDGRFRVLATLTALASVRLESGGDQLSVALTERFVEVMESEHRELGLGDPTLGRKVRKLVGSLARRVELWRSAAARKEEWGQATRQSLYPQDAPDAAVRHGAQLLQTFWIALQSSDDDALALGQIG